MFAVPYGSFIIIQLRTLCVPVSGNKQQFIRFKVVFLQLGLVGISLVLGITSVIGFQTVIVVSHDRYFMDKVVDHLLVFKGQGDIRDFPGNYSDYRDWREAKEQREKEAEKPKEEKTARVRLNDKRKMSFKEKKEFEQLEQEIAGLEQEKADIEAALCSGTLGVEELTEKSKRLPELNDLIDEKTMRWLELSEIEG